MNGLILSLLLGIAAAMALLLGVYGVRFYTYDPVADVDPAVLIDADELPDKKPRRGSLVIRVGAYGVPILRRFLSAKLLRRLQRLIDLAGRPAGVSVDSVLSKQIGLLVLSIPMLFLYRNQFIFLVLMVALVLFWPVLRLITAARKRRELIDKDLPDFLVVVAVTVTAGVSFRSALSTVATRFGGPMGEEITTTLHQIANGATLRSAFVNLRNRTDSAAVDEFVTAYLQAEELGAPLVESLNQIAENIRNSAAQRALQKAAGVGPKISLITTLALVPGTMILIATGLFIGSEIDLGMFIK